MEPKRFSYSTQDDNGGEQNPAVEAMKVVESAARKVASEILGDGFRQFLNDVVSHTISNYMRFCDDMLPNTVRSWAHSVARNKALNVIRSERRYAQRLASLQDFPEDAVPTPSDIILNQECLEAIRRICGFLRDAVDSHSSAEEKALFQLIFCENLSLSDSALKMKVPQHSAARCWGRLLRKLQVTVHKMTEKDPFCAEVLGFLAGRRLNHRFFIKCLQLSAETETIPTEEVAGLCTVRTHISDGNTFKRASIVQLPLITQCCPRLSRPVTETSPAVRLTF